MEPVAWIRHSPQPELAYGDACPPGWRNNATPLYAIKPKRTALSRYQELGRTYLRDMDLIERLRFFCSLAMDGQDWLDVEPFFEEIKRLEFRADTWNHPHSPCICPTDGESCGFVRYCETCPAKPKGAA